ncbi:conserved Plasmodium protein, unknown function, partial [Plasmodium malariae]
NSNNNNSNNNNNNSNNSNNTNNSNNNNSNNTNNSNNNNSNNNNNNNTSNNSSNNNNNNNTSNNSSNNNNNNNTSNNSSNNNSNNNNLNCGSSNNNNCSSLNADQKGNCLKGTFLTRKKNQEDYLNKELNDFFISNKTSNKVNRCSFIEVIYEGKYNDKIYSDKIINSLFYFFNNPYLIFTFHKNVLYYIEMKSKDKNFFLTYKNAHALVKYLNHCVTIITKIFHIFVSSGLYFNRNIMAQKNNKYLNFYKLLNFDSCTTYNNEKNYEFNKYQDFNFSKISMNSKRRRDKKCGNTTSGNDMNTFNETLFEADNLVNDNTYHDRKRSTQKRLSNFDDTNTYDFNIIKYLIKYKNVVSNFCQDDLNRKDSIESEGDQNNFYLSGTNKHKVKNECTMYEKSKDYFLNSNGSYDENRSLYESEYSSSGTGKRRSYYEGSKCQDNSGYESSKYESSQTDEPESDVNEYEWGIVQGDNCRSNIKTERSKHKRGTNEKSKVEGRKVNRCNNERSKRKNLKSSYKYNTLNYNTIYQKEYSNKSLFHDILRKAKKRKKFYEVIGKINKLKNSFDLSNINKNKTIDLNYVENVDTISYFISIYNSDNIFQFDYYFLKFITEIITTYNNYIKCHLISESSIKFKKEILDKIINQIELFLNEITKLIYVYTWCVLYIFGHSYSYVKYAKYFYQKKSFFVLENKEQCVFNNFNYFLQDSGHNNNSDNLHMNNYFTPLNIVENLKYNYELKRNVHEFDNFNFHNLIHIYKNSYFQNIVDKLHLNLKFIENILFTLDNVFKNKKSKKKKFLNYLCVKDQKLDDICKSIENLKRNINKYKKTFHYCLNFNNIKNVISLTLEEMSMSSDKIELNKLLNEYLNKLENRGQLKKRQKKINVKIIDDNIVLDTTNPRKKRRKDLKNRMDDDECSIFSTNKRNQNCFHSSYVDMKNISDPNSHKGVKQKSTSNKNNSIIGSFLRLNNSSGSGTDSDISRVRRGSRVRSGSNQKKKSVSKQNTMIPYKDNFSLKKNRKNIENKINDATDNDSYCDNEEANESYTRSDRNSKSIHNDNSYLDYNNKSEENSSLEDMLETRSKISYYDKTISTSSSPNSGRSSSRSSSGSISRGNHNKYSRHNRKYRQRI